jgi:hypothetical protein
MSQNDERYPEVHTVESNDYDHNSLSSTRQILPNEEPVIIRQEQPLLDSISIAEPSSRPESWEPRLLQPLLHYVYLALNSFPTLTITTVNSELRFDRLQEKARFCVKIDGKESSSVMAANDQYLLYCPPKRLCVIDEQGVEQLSVERSFNVGDACWSSYLNQFLIVSNKLLYSLDLSTKHLLLIKQFDISMSHCTCYADTFIVVPNISNNRSAPVHAYNMSTTTNNWTLVRPLRTGQTSIRRVTAIRFNSTGSRVGVVTWSDLSPSTWFQCYGRYDLNIAQSSSLLRSFSFLNPRWHLLSLPDQIFLLNVVGNERKLLLINRDGNIKELKVLFDSSWEDDDFIYTTAFIAGEKKCLVIQTLNQLRFYDL